MSTKTYHRPHVARHRTHVPPRPKIPVGPFEPSTTPGRTPRTVLATLLVVVLALTALAGLLVTVLQDAPPAYTQGQLADIARLEAQADAYLQEARLEELQRGYEADTARWIARAEYHQQQREARVNAAATARLEGQARAYHLSQLSRGDRAWAERLRAQAEAELQP
jgi:hypothetical protein